MSVEFPQTHTDLGGLQPEITLGALDGRYRSAVTGLVDWFSEAALNRARLFVEIEINLRLCLQLLLKLLPVAIFRHKVPSAHISLHLQS